ncbi:hypothetical protein [Paenibacillus sp. Marseille-Q4541]|uniref:hypothetical protein n=1 Tax=Paenibacillus sp. Marseille-Q4541 TaxID=2831522 RepID=UPI001BAAF8B4|nr:hypothetical protein [Paenibacillus sp. Marseille-Q4541]
MKLEEKSKRYYHDKCYEQYKIKQEETKIENEQWNKLYQYIVGLHDLLLLPKGNIMRLKELRAGFEIKDGKRVRKYRTGPDYELMLDAYKLADSSIRWCIANTLKGSNDVRAINYCISIMMNSLNEAFARRKNRLRQQEEIRQDLGNQNNLYIETEVVYKAKNKNNNDISNFL